MTHAPVYLLRHGETQWNTQRRMQGGLDSPLTALGRAQAKALGETLRGHVDAQCAILSSPQGRAAATAQIVADAIGIRAIGHDERLREMSWGAMDGHTTDEIEIKWPGQIAARRANYWQYVPPGGESYAMVSERLRSFVAELAVTTTPLIVVSHGACGRALRGLYLKLHPTEIAMLGEPQHIAFRLHRDIIEEIAVDQSALFLPS